MTSLFCYLGTEARLVQPPRFDICLQMADCVYLDKEEIVTFHAPFALTARGKKTALDIHLKAAKQQETKPLQRILKRE